MPTPPERIEELAKELRMVANMINMGEKIQWARETTLMDKSADMLEVLHQELQKAREEGYKAGKKSFLKDIARLGNVLKDSKVSYIIHDEAGTIDWDKVIHHSELDQPTV